MEWVVWTLTLVLGWLASSCVLQKRLAWSQYFPILGNLLIKTFLFPTTFGVMLVFSGRQLNPTLFGNSFTDQLLSQ